MSGGVTAERLRALPKTDLHVHLDGSLRPATMLDLADDLGVRLPAASAPELAEHMHVRQGRDLVDYLARFETTLQLMQTPAALERIAYELAADAAAENVRYMEVRWSPLLNTRGGLALEEALEAPLRGLRRAERDFSIRSTAVICGLRHLEPMANVRLAELAAAYRDQGVVAFDLAGAEHGHPPTDHIAAFDVAADAHLGITIHAGEAYGPPSIHEAIHRCHARRIGHGTRLHEDPALMRFVNDHRIPLEICLTSNVQTRAVTALRDHPLRLYYDQGLVVTLNTDNRLMSGTTVTQEYMRAHEHLGLSWTALTEIALDGFRSAFLSHEERVALVAEVAAEMALLGG